MVLRVEERLWVRVRVRVKLVTTSRDASTGMPLLVPRLYLILWIVKTELRSDECG